MTVFLDHFQVVFLVTFILSTHVVALALGVSFGLILVKRIIEIEIENRRGSASNH